MPLVALGVDMRTLRQRQPDLIRLTNRRHERGAILLFLAFGAATCPSITHVRFAAKSGNVSETFFEPGCIG
jgi:hypothetical protein